MRILITGGAGFIGSNLAVHFAARGHAITLFDNPQKLLKVKIFAKYEPW